MKHQRLFAVRCDNSPVVDEKKQPIYFAEKAAAKVMRDDLGGVERGYHVTRGPDHMGKHGDSPNGVPYMRRQAKHRG